MKGRKRLAWAGRIAGLLLAVLVVTTLVFASMSVEPIKREKRQMSEVWNDFPFESHYITVLGSSMHYIDEGPRDGPTFLLLHGNPTSSYLWRSVVPELLATGSRVIAVDNIGFGASDRPAIAYTFNDHSAYVDEFIQKMDLKAITLVLHDWGSAIGLDYARRHEANVSAIALMEGITKIPSMDNLEGAPKVLFKSMRSPGLGELLVLGSNFFVETLLPMSVVRELRTDELNAYREPFASIRSRVPTLMLPREIPFDGRPRAVAERVEAYVEWVANADLPKLLLYANPGALISPAYALQIQQSWLHTQTHFLGEGIHYVQEDHGADIGRAIAKWRIQSVQ